MKNLKKITTSIAIILLFTYNLNAQFRINNDGKIRIGSSSSTYITSPLEVIGNSVFRNNLNAITSSPFIVGTNNYSSTNAPDYTYYWDNKTGIFHPSFGILGITINGTKELEINQGNVNWCHNICSYVNSDYQLSYKLNSNYGDVFYVRGDGNVAARGNFYSYSDESIKNNITQIESALDKVLKLRGVTYYLNKSSKNLSNDAFDTTINKINNELLSTMQKEASLKNMGLIAQEVEQIVPEVVRTMHDGNKAICYQSLIGLLIEAFKEQENKINSLEDNINQLQNLVAQNTNSPIINNNKNLLFQNTPNPFNDLTEIKYFTNSSDAIIIIYSLNGIQLKKYPINTIGEGSITIKGGELESGAYFYTLIVNKNEIDTKKMILTD